MADYASLILPTPSLSVFACDKRKAFAHGSNATKQSIFISLMPSYGLLRGACHRARIRATRWLAMTAMERAASQSSLPATDAKRLRTGAKATKQSTFISAMPS